MQLKHDLPPKLTGLLRRALIREAVKNTYGNSGEAAESHCSGERTGTQDNY